VHLVFDIFQAIGLAAAAGVRPFLPALAAGALAAGNVELNFKHTDYAFLQGAPFLLVVVVAVIIVTLVERQVQARGAGAGKAGAGARKTAAGKAGGAGAGVAGTGVAGVVARAGIDPSPLAVVLVLAGAVIGALFFAGELARGHSIVWAGYIGGPVCALVGAAATQPIFARVRARLDAAAAQALPVYAEGTALLLAVLSVVAPPVGPIALALLVWLLIGGRRRGERKYAGLRILR
jgi:hypothetical protein